MWFYIKNKQRVGPVSEEDISKLISYGAITGKTLVYKKGMKQWTEAQHTELGSRIPKILKVFEEMSENADSSANQHDYHKKSEFPLSLIIGFIAVIVLAGLSAAYYFMTGKPHKDDESVAVQNLESSDNQNKSEIETMMKEVKEAKGEEGRVDKEKIVAVLRKIEELAAKNSSDANAAKRRVMVIDKKSGTVSVVEIENNTLGLFGLASTQESNQNYEEALKFYSEALSLDSEFAQAYFGRGNCYYNLGDVQKAIRDYGRAIEYKQDYAEAYNNRGMAFNLVGDFNGALKDLNIAIGLKGEVANSYYLRAKTYANLGYPADKIIGEYDMAIKFDSSHWAAYTNRGVQYMTAFGDTENGCADFKRACELGHCDGYQMGVRNGHCK